jgi:anthraniloyl-CoA monooxygenase
MTCVTPEGRITPGCAGMYRDEHVAAWTRIVDFVHRHTEAKICLQLGHSGPKGSTKLGWEGMDEPLDEGNWELIGPSAVPWSPHNQVPRPMTRADMDDVLSAFVRATAMAEVCRAALRTRLSAVRVHHAADEPAHGRVWRSA